MEHKIPIITKKIWSLIVFMLKKGISKTKLSQNLSMMMKQRKIASGEYEFSCSNTPPYPISLFSTRMHKHQNNRHRLANHNPPLAVDDCGDIAIDPAIIKALDMMIKSPAASPTVMPGFMKSPVAHGLEDGQVDENAEKFIRRLYNNMRVEMTN
ncbi:hypothetical protein R6Q59_036109 [Mikania micrantha]